MCLQCFESGDDYRSEITFPCFESGADYRSEITFPCVESGADYCSEITYYMGFIENILDTVSHTDVIILGDTNFHINSSNPGFVIMNSLLNCYNILPCDDLLSGLDQATYVNAALNSSFTKIDRCFVSQGLHDLVSIYH